MSDRVYSIQELLDELKPPYTDQVHLADVIGALEDHFERPWREETPFAVLVDGFAPILAEYLQLSDVARKKLLACLCHLFDPYADEKLDLDISVIKDNLQILEPSGLTRALSVIADEGASDAEERIIPYLSHEKESVRETAQDELEELVSVREFHHRRSEGRA